MKKYWELVVERKDVIGPDKWVWKSEEKDKALRIFDAYCNTVQQKSKQIYEIKEHYIKTDYGSVTLTYRTEINDTSKPSGYIFCPYVESLF